MLKKDASLIVGGLGSPSKMPGKAIGISAFACQTGGKLAKVPGSVCAKCYARKGNYVFKNVRESHARRMSALMRALSTPEARTQWVSAMASLLKGETYFRWHDAGDLQNADHYALIVEVCHATPWVKHWLPTKEPRYVDRANVPANLVVRISAPMVDAAPPKSWPNASAVHTSKAIAGAHVCPAPKQDGHCADCRACWSKSVAVVSYHQH